MAYDGFKSINLRILVCNEHDKWSTDGQLNVFQFEYEYCVIDRVYCFDLKLPDKLFYFKMTLQGKIVKL